MSRNCFLISRIIYVMVVWFCHLYRFSCIMWCRIYVQYKHASVMSSRHILNSLQQWIQIRKWWMKILQMINSIIVFLSLFAPTLINTILRFINSGQIPLNFKNTWIIFLFNPQQTNVPIKVIRIKPRTWFNPFKHHIKAWRRIRRWYWL